MHTNSDQHKKSSVIVSKHVTNINNKFVSNQAREMGFVNVEYETEFYLTNN